MQQAGERTQVTVDTDLKIVGKLAQFGSGMLQQVSEKLLGQFVESLEAELRAQSAPGPQPAPEASTETRQAPAAAEPAPIDLLELAGADQLKKYAPILLGALVALLALFWVVRRRR